MTADVLRRLILNGTDRSFAEHVCGQLKDLPGPALFRLLDAAGVWGIRPKDSRPMLLKRLALALTAKVRADERNEV